MTNDEALLKLAEILEQQQESIVSLTNLISAVVDRVEELGAMIPDDAPVRTIGDSDGIVMTRKLPTSPWPTEEVRR